MCKYCKFQTPFTDEQGYYDSDLCIKDFRECDGKCNEHEEKLNKKIARLTAKLKDEIIALKLKVDRTIYIWTKKR